MSESQSDPGNCRDYSSLEGHTFADDERTSVMAVGVASPHTTGVPVGEISSAHHSYAADAGGGITWQLDLNERNLHSFKATVQLGNVPLRTDFVDSRDYAAAGRAAEKTHSATRRTGARSTPSRGMETEHSNKGYESSHHVVGGGERSGGERGGAAHNSHQSTSVSMSESASMNGNDAKNPLNVNNLERHVQILSSGKPAILRPENIGVSFDSQANNPGGSPDVRYAGSLLVEPPSECSIHEGSRGHFGQSNLNVFQDMDQWSTQSVGDIGFSDFISESNLRSLSKDNLLQLKRELESDSIPLRPELLAGLENAVKAITGSAADSEEPSLFVACSQHATQELAMDIPDTDTNRDPSAKFVMQDASSDVAQDMEPGTAGMSFHSMLVEAGQTEIPERKEDDAMCSLAGSNSATLHPDLEHNSEEVIPEEEDEAKSDSDDSREGYYSSNITDNEDRIEMVRHMKRLSGGKRFASTPRSEHLLAEELIENNTRCMRALQEATVTQMKTLCDRLEKLESCISRVVQSQRGLDEQLRSHYLPLPSAPSSTSNSSSVVRLSVRLVHPGTSSVRCVEGQSSADGGSSGSTPCEYLLPFASSSTVGECSSIALERLQRIRVVEPGTPITQVSLNGMILFEEDSLQSLGITSGDTLEMHTSKA